MLCTDEGFGEMRRVGSEMQAGSISAAPPVGCFLFVWDFFRWIC